MKFIIFDLDDTLLCGDCEAGWINFLVYKGLLDDDEYSLKINQFDLDYRKGVLNFYEYSTFIQEPLKNLDTVKVGNLVDEFIKNNIDDLTDDLTDDLLKESKSADKVLIASGSHDFLVKGFAEYFEIESSIGTPVEIKNDIFTGCLSGEPTFSDGKVKAIKKWCFDNDFKVEDSIFYSDSINDLPMFESCGKAIAVNPDEKLRKIALNRNYKIINR
tara:strand:- start:2082 stop:2729 length:648 start_codon:yes stop_codon:yes gene_type:complete